MENEKAKRAKRATKKAKMDLDTFGAEPNDALRAAHARQAERVSEEPQWRPYTDEELGRRDLLRECNAQELPPSMRSVRPQQVSVLVLIHAGAILAGAILAEGIADALSFGWKDAQ